MAPTTRTQPWTHDRPKLTGFLAPPIRIVNDHKAINQSSRLIDIPHAVETILLAKDG